MSAYDYNSLRKHIGHSIVCVCYGKENQAPLNVALECEICDEVLLDFDAPEHWTDEQLDAAITRGII